MSEPAVTRAQIEELADRIGAPRTSVLKWRKRGIPGDWALKIVAHSRGLVSAEDMLAFAQTDTSTPADGAAA